jgi:precorrin-6x reductase
VRRDPPTLRFVGACDVVVQEAPIVKVRDAKPEELAPKPRRVKPLSPRQQAIKKREAAIEKVLNELGAGPASWIKKVELEDGEKLVTIRAAIVKQIKVTKSSVRLAVRNGGIYLSRGPIPRSGGGRKPKGE